MNSISRRSPRRPYDLRHAKMEIVRSETKDVLALYGVGEQSELESAMAAFKDALQQCVKAAANSSEDALRAFMPPVSESVERKTTQLMRDIQRVEKDEDEEEHKIELTTDFLRNFGTQGLICLESRLENFSDSICSVLECLGTVSDNQTLRLREHLFCKLLEHREPAYRNIAALSLCAPEFQVDKELVQLCLDKEKNSLVAEGLKCLAIKIGA